MLEWSLGIVKVKPITSGAETARSVQTNTASCRGKKFHSMQLSLFFPVALQPLSLHCKTSLHHDPASDRISELDGPDGTAEREGRSKTRSSFGTRPEQRAVEWPCYTKLVVIVDGSPGLFLFISRPQFRSVSIVSFWHLFSPLAPRLFTSRCNVTIKLSLEKCSRKKRQRLRRRRRPSKPWLRDKASRAMAPRSGIPSGSEGLRVPWRRASRTRWI